jgi:thiamine pyrophosphate-dependent acetolactate synthase large subunit-like protein
MDQVVDVLWDWGLDAVFGMVGHSNLGMADDRPDVDVDRR